MQERQSVCKRERINKRVQKISLRHSQASRLIRDAWNENRLVDSPGYSINQYVSFPSENLIQWRIYIQTEYDGREVIPISD